MLRPFCGWFALLCLASGLPGADFPDVEMLVPGVGQRGTQFTCTLIGAGLSDVEEAVVYTPGLVVRMIEVVSENECRIEFEAAPDAALGSYALRLRTRRGLSSLQRLRITSLPVTTENEPNNALDKSQVVPLNATVAGIMESGDVDSFAVELQAGERLAAAVEGVRMGGVLLDTILKIFAPDGQLLAEVDDTALLHQDPCASIIAPVAGRYVIQLHESSFEGSDQSRYAVHIGNFPLPTYAFPPGGHGGEMTTITLGGDAGGEFSQTIQLPMVSEPTELLLYAEENGRTSPLPIPLRVAPVANHNESEPNDRSPHNGVETATFPAGINGCLQSPSDMDTYSVRCEAGRTYQIESFGWRLGSPVDTVLQLFDRSGRLLLASDDVDSHDSQMGFTPPHTGEYLLKVFDKSGKGGADFVYRIEATLEKPRLTAFLPRPDRLSQDGQTINVPRGNRVLVQLGCRREGVTGDVRLVPSGLPEGVGLSDMMIPADRYWMPVVVEAQEQAPVDGSLIDIQAYGEAEGQAVVGAFRQHVDQVTGPGETVYETTTVERLAVAVIEPVPLHVSLAQPQAPLAQAGTLALQVTVQRESGFTGLVEVSLPFLPPWVDGPASITIPAEADTADYPLRAHAQAEVRSWPICAVARPAVSSGRDGNGGMPGVPGYRGRAVTTTSLPICSELTMLNVIAPPITGQLVDTDCEQGRSACIRCTMQVVGELPRHLTATLRGLPNRVTAKNVHIESGATNVVFPLELEPDSPLGKFPDLSCELSGLLHGEQVTYTVALGSTLTIHAPGQLVRDSNGRPLSPLDLLKQKLTSDSTGDSR